MIKVQIDRKTWLRGVGSNDSVYKVRLRTEEGEQCCLGFVCKKLGLKNKDILDVGRPGHLVRYDNFAQRNAKEKLTPVLLKVKEPTEKAWVEEAITINDDSLMSETEREEKLTKLFAKNGLDVKFVGPKVNPFTEK